MPDRESCHLKGENNLMYLALNITFNPLIAPLWTLFTLEGKNKLS